MIDTPFLGSAAVSTGQLTRAQLRGPRFHRLFRDVYLPAGLEPDLAMRSRAAYLLVEGRGALAGYSAAELLGAPCAPRDAPAEIVLPRGYLRHRAGLIVRQDVVGADELRYARGCTVTTALRTAFDLARRLPLVDAVVALDALAACAGFAPAKVLELRDRYPGVRGCRRLDTIVDLADPNADSPMETRLRLLLVLGGLPRPVVSHPVPDEHAHIVARLDLAYPHAFLGIEYDGDAHLERARRNHDLNRDGRLAELGWLVLRFGAFDVLGRPERTVDRVRRVLGAREPVRPTGTNHPEHGYG